MPKITFKWLLQLQAKLRALVREFNDVFATKVRREPVTVEPMKIVVDEDKWRLPCKQSEEKQRERDKEASGPPLKQVLSKSRKPPNGAKFM